MMLRALYDLARREKLLEDPDYEKKPAHFLLRIDHEGRFRGLLPVGDKKGKLIDVPRMPKRAVNVVSGFLFDNAKYVLGLGGENPERNVACVAEFTRLVEEAYEATHDEGALAVVRFLRDRGGNGAPLLRERPADAWTGSENIALVLETDDDRPVFERAALRAYWAGQRAKEGGEGEPVTCLVTGAMAVPTRLHGNIKRVPGASTMGAALVSFNADAFSSHGLEQGENAPVSRAAAEGYVAGLNSLLEPYGKRRYRYGVQVGEESVTVFWTREKNEAVNVFADLFGGADEKAEAAVHMAESPLQGLAPRDIDATAFYAATLGTSGNSRVVVRDWFESTVVEVKRNVLRYFDDLRLGSTEPETLPLWALLKSLEAPGGGGVSPDLLARFFAAALRGRPFPREVLSAALRRLRRPPDPMRERQQLFARCALIKATLRRLPNVAPAYREVSVSLDETCDNKAYLLGRLFATLERLQGAALGDINATIRDRYFGAASSTPALVFPRLIRTAVHHAAKAEQGSWFERVIGEIMAKLPAAALPATLTLEDQGLFAIGYYHQRDKFFEKKKEEPKPAMAASGAASGAAPAAGHEGDERGAS
jgi:CRISPR-associated protein Csd1